MAQVITLDDNHIYRVDGRKMPSVTGIIKAAGLINDQWFDEASAFRGSVVHRLCEYDCKGTLDEDSVDPGAAGYLAAWRDWKRQIGYIQGKIEELMFHPTLFYCGTPDRFGLLYDGTRCVVDLKTGAAQKWHSLQLAAYAQFDSIPRRIRRFTVRLSADGQYTTTEYETSALPGDWAAFQGMLAVQNWRKINGA